MCKTYAACDVFTTIQFLDWEAFKCRVNGVDDILPQDMQNIKT